MQGFIKKAGFTLTAVGLGFAPQLTFAAVTLVNPIGVTDPRAIIGNLIKAVLSIVGSLALLMFVYGGVIWITSFGEAKRIEKGKTIITWAVLGLAVIASAYVLVNAVIQGLVTGSATTPVGG
jgi:fumarate reductase subunit D